jgi:hypothetical protein
MEAQKHQSDQERRHFEVLDAVGIPSAIAQRTDLYQEFLGLRKAFSDLVRSENVLLEQVAALKLAAMNQELLALSLGKIEFMKTEAWRLVYEQLLLHGDLKFYRSVAWLRSEEYWQDVPGRQSMMTNYQALERGLRIQRLLILPESMLSEEALQPIRKIEDWILEQVAHGVELRWVREKDLVGESNLVGDFGIYGETAVGEQDIDDRCRTLRFSLSFDARDLELAKQRWTRLELFARAVI